MVYIPYLSTDSGTVIILSTPFKGRIIALVSRVSSSAMAKHINNLLLVEDFCSFAMTAMVNALPMIPTRIIAVVPIPRVMKENTLQVAVYGMFPVASVFVSMTLLVLIFGKKFSGWSIQGLLTLLIYTASCTCMAKNLGARTSYVIPDLRRRFLIKKGIDA
jgi:hypothetical protein